MKKNKILILCSFLLVSLILAACGTRVLPSGWPGIAVDGDTVYVANEAHVYALQQSNGLERWRFPAEPERNINFFAAPTLTDDDQLLVGSYNRSNGNGFLLFSLDASSGDEIWRDDSASNRYIGSPLATEDSIFAPNSDSYLYKLNLSGNPDLDPDWPIKSQEPLWASPVFDGETIFLPAMDHYLYAINAESGTLSWDPLDLGGALASAPTLDPDGTLYISSFGEEVYAINSRNGAIEWQFSTEDWVWGSPALANDVVYFGDLSGNFYAVNASNGNEKWHLEADGAITGKPLVHEGMIYFVTEAGSLYAVIADTNGEIDWRQSHDDEEAKFYGSPLLTGDLIMVSTGGLDKIVIAYDLDGNEIWSLDPNN
ncbi:MAG: PQQ-binding-like beta-propeller repeat protein [Chloroflexi bacterium]|nr:PQQ-binding-like beta-propeller repeat protein [Chloroflexota bacterium]